MNISATPIGMFLTPFKTPGQIPLEMHESGTEVVIDVFPQHRALLDDLKEYPYVRVMYAPPKKAAQVKPPALSVLRLKGILGSLVIVEGADVLDQTPVLEMKAYIAGCDGCYAERFEWFGEKPGNTWRPFPDRKEF